MIDPDISIRDLTDKHPQLVTHLIQEYGFHCVSCFASEFETLREGAAVHGIVDAYFDDLIADLESLVKKGPANLSPAQKEQNTAAIA